MKKISCNIIPVVIGLSMCMLLAGCGNPITQTEIPAQSANVTVTSSESSSQNSSNNIFEAVPSWARAYDLESLVWEADLVVEATITGRKGIRYVGSSIYTDYTADILRILKSPTGFAERSIVIASYGGTYQGQTYVMKENGLYQVGDLVFLFLKDSSDNPVHSPNRETKYMVLMPGGRFHIKPDGKLDTPTTKLAVAEKYRGRDKTELEKDVLARIPSPADYLQNAVRASFLITEGKVVTVQETRLALEEVTAEDIAQSKARGELPTSVLTFYTFAVDKVLKDEIAQNKDAPRKTIKYDRPPVADGQMISVIEIGGTYEGITQRRTWAQFLRPGDKMVLFLRAIVCEDRVSVCTKAERETHRLLYIIEDDTDRFLIGSDNRLTAITRLPVSRFYHGQPKERLEKDIATEKIKWERILEEMKKLPTATPLPFPLPPTPTPSR
jgi:hypothetical protein